MKIQNIFKAATALLFIASAFGCSSDGDGLGTQIDRMGRPAVNTALNNTFTDDATRGAAEDTYNETKSSNGDRFIAEIAGNLAIYDALVDEGGDDNACGDNPLTNRVGAGTAELATGDNRYTFLATVLADDELYINASISGGSDAGQCTQYLAAELTVLGVDLGNDCGGRTPTYDVIDVTYSAVAAGDVAGVGDGVPTDDASQSDTVFPFLAAPM
jgi:hypothetical protein